MRNILIALVAISLNLSAAIPALADGAFSDGRSYVGFRGGVGAATFGDTTSSKGGTADCPVIECQFEAAGSSRFTFGREYGPWRFDGNLEFSYRTDVENLVFRDAAGQSLAGFDSNIRNYTAVLQAYRHFPISEPWTLYVGAGIGATYYEAKSRANIGGAKTDGVNPVGRIMLGATIDLSTNWMLELGYAFNHYGSVDLSSARSNATAEIGRVLEHDATFGFIYRF